jgi:hypothetical protein
MEVSCPQADPIGRIKIDLTTNSYSSFLPINVLKNCVPAPIFPPRSPRKNKGPVLNPNSIFLRIDSLRCAFIWLLQVVKKATKRMKNLNLNGLILIDNGSGGCLVSIENPEVQI